MNPPSSGIASTSIPAAGRYRLDPALTTVRLNTRHLFGLGAVMGTVRLREGTFVVADPPTATTLHAVLDAASFDTGNAQRDAAVRSPKLLNVSAFPDIIFESQQINQHDRWEVAGVLTVRGGTAPIALTLTELQNVTAEQVILRATAKIDRYAHRITAAKGLAARRLAIEITTTAIRATN